MMKLTARWGRLAEFFVARHAERSHRASEAMAWLYIRDQ